MPDTIIVGDLITEREISALAKFIKSHPEERTVHNLIMTWLDKQPKIMEKFRTHGVIKAYGAWMFEYHLKLT